MKLINVVDSGTLSSGNNLFFLNSIGVCKVSLKEFNENEAMIAFPPLADSSLRTVKVYQLFRSKWNRIHSLLVFYINRIHMLGKVKNWLGIEGVKMEIETPERVRLRDGVLKGTVIFQSMNDKKITKVKFSLIEKYTRGRGKAKLINEYTLGDMEINETHEVKANGQLRMDFKLLFNPKVSEMDQMGQNLLLRGPVALAKFIKGAKSIYRLEVEAKVPGTALSPFAKAEINFY